MKIVKIRTLLVAGIAGGAGYVLGTKAGQSRYAELMVQADKLRATADRLARSPQVRETVANVADKVKETAEKLPDPVAGVVNKVADSATEATGGSTPDAPSTGLSDSGLSDSGLSDTPITDTTITGTGTGDIDTETRPGTTPTPGV